MTNAMQNQRRTRRVIGVARRNPRPSILLAATIALLLGALASSRSGTAAPPTAQDGPKAESSKTASAIFAGGCFWCMEKPFDGLPGVTATTSGYTGGTLAGPTYEQVSSGNTGHIEAVRIDYDPSLVSYSTLVDVFWRNVDPLDARGQFCDKGYQYTSAIFHGSEEEKRVAESSKRALEESGKFQAPIVTRILPATEFYDAEEYHQDYYEKNPIRYRYYRHGCGRDARLEQLWGTEAGGKDIAAKPKGPA